MHSLCADAKELKILLQFHASRKVIIIFSYTLDAVLGTVPKWVWSITKFLLSVNKYKGSQF